MRSGWQEALQREGLAPVMLVAEADLEDGEHPPCPACGTAAALVEGACSDCGLFLG
jgi:hypothetical protein